MDFNCFYIIMEMLGIIIRPIFFITGKSGFF